MTEKTEAQTNEIKSEEQTAARKPDGVFTRKFGAKTFIAEIFFNHSSRDTFQDNAMKSTKCFILKENNVSYSLCTRLLISI